ncbi:MAG: hypothetical protein Q8Q14_08040 [Gemmatimonadales bacterium]|nr:hypothetical protein [Gemmatimonadales bacterium]
MIGASHDRIGGDRLAAGAGRFVADVCAPGMLHAALLRSAYGHARLVSIDAKRALERRGVHALRSDRVELADIVRAHAGPLTGRRRPWRLPP